MKNKFGRLVVSVLTAALLCGCSNGNPSSAANDAESSAAAVSSAVSQAASSSAAAVSSAPASSAASSVSSSSSAPASSVVSSSSAVQSSSSEQPAVSSSEPAPVISSSEESVPAPVESSSSEPVVVPPQPTGSTPVAQHGQLTLNGTQIVDQYGEPFQLRGMSTHGITWFPDFVNANAFKTLRDDWNTNIVRIAMYIDEWDNDMCYMKNKQGSRQMLEKGVDICLDLGMYVIIDWHMLNPGDPTKYTNEAKEFFDYITKKYGDKPNVLYEICNEPNSGADWNSKIKPYAEQVIPVIRANDPDAIIIVGTPTWSQDIDKALANPLSFDNVMYAVHFYADTHRDWLRDRVRSCLNGGLPIFCSEFGTCDASGGGGNNFGETEKWLTMFDELKISYCCWALADKNETCCVIRPGAGANGGWSDGQLSDCGKWISNWFRSHG